MDACGPKKTKDDFLMGTCWPTTLYIRTYLGSNIIHLKFSIWKFRNYFFWVIKISQRYSNWLFINVNLEEVEFTLDVKF